MSFAKKLLGRISRFAAFAGAVILLASYILVVGASASLLRAGIISFIGLATWFYGRRMHPFRMIIYALAISLAYNPRFVGNIAWWLSFASYFGVVVMAPILVCYFYGKTKPSYLAGSIIVTISAQVMCLPISIYAFGSISILGVIANLVISPTIALAMALSLTSAIFPTLAVLAKLILRMHIGTVQMLSTWQWGIIDLESGQA